MFAIASKDDNFDDEAIDMFDAKADAQKENLEAEKFDRPE